MNLGHGERLAHFGHPLLPGLFAHQGNAINLRAVRGGEFDVIPKSVQIPAVEVVEDRQQPHFAVLDDCCIDDRDKRLLVLIVQLAGHLEAQDLLGIQRNMLDHRDLHS